MSAGHRHGDEKAASALADQYYERTAALVAVCTVDASYDVPWLANRSIDGTIVYRDRHVPQILPKTGIDTDKTLPWHELGEWLAENDGLPYDTGAPNAHGDVATPLERRAVEAQKPDDLGIWAKYTDEMDGYIRAVDDETIARVPSDIDLRPFEDDDRKLLEELIVAGAEKSAALRTVMPQILKPKDVAARFQGGESVDAIFFDEAGGYKAKLLGPQASVEAGSEGERSVDFVISTEAVDRYTDIISLGGWRTQNYVRNPVVLWAHDDSIPAIARGSNVRVEGKALRSTAIFAEREFHPLADTVFQLIKGKFISAASVGFVPLKAKQAPGKDRPYGIDILEQELLEWSVVNIPANPECLVNARSVGVDCAPLIGWAERVLDKGGMLLIPRAELEALRKAAGAAAPFVVKTPPPRTVKSLWHVAWLADILMDLDCLEDCVEWEAALEEDDSPIPQQLHDALKALGQILIDLTKEEVAELLADEDAEDVAEVVGEPVALAVKRMRVLRLLAKADEKVLGAVAAALTPAKKGGLVDLIAIKAAIGAVLKSGRVLSAENEKTLRSAHDHAKSAIDHCAAACEHVMGVIEQNMKPDETDPADDDPDNVPEEDSMKAARESRDRRVRLLKLSAAPLIVP